VFAPYGANFARMKPGRICSFSNFEKTLQSAAVHLIVGWYEHYEHEQRSRMPSARPATSSRSGTR
jgi:hypothetical protein